jgi:predicted transcriptional regulator of viral defense system
MASADSKTQQVLRLAAAGPIRARDLDDLGVPRTYLRRLTERGHLEQVDRGLYRLANAQLNELSSLAEVAKRVPHAVVCLLSALQVHSLTSEAPHAVWILIDRHARLPRFATPRIEVVRASGEARTHGIQSAVIDGVEVFVTTPAKTVADCFRYRAHVGLEVAIAALRGYLSKSGRTVDALFEAARADRVFALMRPYIEATV